MVKTSFCHIVGATCGGGAAWCPDCNTCISFHLSKGVQRSIASRDNLKVRSTDGRTDISTTIPHRTTAVAEGVKNWDQYSVDREITNSFENHTNPDPNPNYCPNSKY